jgi:hypothetical protein
VHAASFRHSLLPADLPADLNAYDVHVYVYVYVRMHNSNQNDAVSRF